MEKRGKEKREQKRNQGGVAGADQVSGTLLALPAGLVQTD